VPCRNAASPFIAAFRTEASAMRGWRDGIIPLAAAGLALLGGERAHGQTLATHRIPAALALETVDTAVAACTAQGW
jgi:hypothetical protein